MKSSPVIHHSELDISRVTVSGKPKDVTGRDGTLFGRRVYLQYDHPKHGLIPLKIKSSKQKLLFGLSVYPPTATRSPEDKLSYSANVVLDSDSAKELKFYNDLDNLVVDFMEKHYPAWFPMKKGAKVPIRAVLENNRTALVKVGTNKDTDEEYAPTVKYTFPVYPNRDSGVPECTTKVFLSSTQNLEIDLDEPQNTIPAGSYAETVVICTLYAGAGTGKVSTKLEALMMKVYPKETEVLSYDDVFEDDAPCSVQHDDAAEFSD